MKRLYKKPMAFVERLDISDVIALDCTTSISTLLNFSTSACFYDLDGETIFSSYCSVNTDSEYYNDLCYNGPLTANGIYGS